MPKYMQRLGLVKNTSWEVGANASRQISPDVRLLYLFHYGTVVLNGFIPRHH